MLPDNLRALLRDHLTSFECLELLLFLHGHRGEPSSVESVSSLTGVSIDRTVATLAALEASQLVQRSVMEPLTYHFAPLTASLTQTVDDLARLYRDQRAAIMSEMSINAIGRIRSESLRAFADAFVFGTHKRDPDG